MEHQEHRQLSKDAINKMIQYHVLCVRYGDKTYAISHCKVVAELTNTSSIQQIAGIYLNYVGYCSSLGVSYTKNFDEEALRESLQAGATQFMDTRSYI